MKKVGLILIVIGLVWVIIAFNMSTAVKTESETIGSGDFSIHIPSMEINNVGLMDQRRNHMMASIAMILSGILLYGFGAISESRKITGAANEPYIGAKKPMADDTKKCPACAEIIKFEATKCKHCGETFDPSEIQKQADERKAAMQEQKARIETSRSYESEDFKRLKEQWASGQISLAEFNKRKKYIQ